MGEECCSLIITENGEAIQPRCPRDRSLKRIGEKLNGESGLPANIDSSRYATE